MHKDTQIYKNQKIRKIHKKCDTQLHELKQLFTNIHKYTKYIKL